MAGLKFFTIRLIQWPIYDKTYVLYQMKKLMYMYQMKECNNGVQYLIHIHIRTSTILGMVDVLSYSICVSLRK